MKKIILALVILLPILLRAQNCKPDLNKIDNISKKEIKIWESVIYESGFGNSLINTSDWKLTLQYGRYSGQNLISLFLAKYEESAQNASFESQYRGDVGKSYYLAFSQGEPIELIVEKTSTESKMDNLNGKLITTVTLTSLLTDNNIKDFKTHFENGSLNAVRVILAGGIYFSKDVKGNKATTANDKFTCFYNFNASNKIIEPVEQDFNNLLPNPNVPLVMPKDSITNKITFTGVVALNGSTKDQLYNRARSWMINYYKNEQFAINNKEDGRLSREGVFSKTYNIGDGKISTHKYYFNISVYIKDGKYKYELTDFVIEIDKSKYILEATYEKLQGMNRTKYMKYMNQQIYEGVDEVLKNLKEAMIKDITSNSDW